MKNKIIAQKILNRADAATRLTPLVVKLKVLAKKHQYSPRYIPVQDLLSLLTEVKESYSVLCSSEGDKARVSEAFVLKAESAAQDKDLYNDF